MSCPNLPLLLSLIVVSASAQTTPKTYVSLAKLIVAGADVNPKLDDGNAIPEDFYGTNIEILESAAMRRQSLERLRLTNPDSKEVDVYVKITRNKGSRIFNVAAVGADPKFTRIFLDALLDEFIAFRGNLREQGRNKQLVVMAEDVVRLEARLKECGEKLAAAKKQSVNAAVLEAEHNRRIEVLMGLRTAKAGAKEQAEAEARVREASEALDVFMHAQNNYGTVEKQYSSAYASVHAFQLQEEAKPEAISILQRAEAAVDASAVPR